MNAAAWGVVAPIVTTIGVLVMYFASKRHTEGNEDAATLSGTISAIGDAAVDVVTASTSVSTLVRSMIQPLQDELNATRQELKETREELDAHRLQAAEREAHHAECAERIDHLEQQFGVIITYVRALRSQVRQMGLEPLDPPDPLEGLQFD